MEIRVFSEAELPVALGAVRATEIRPSADQDGLLAAVARLHGVELDPTHLPQPSLAYTARAFRDRRTKRQLLGLAVAMTVDDSELPPVPVPSVSLLARALGENDGEMRALRERAAHQKLLTRVDFTRRMAASMFGDERASEQEADVRKAVSDALRVSDHAEVASQYHALGRLHPMSFGYSLWHHYRTNRFRFPGEGGGVPEQLLAHDVSHVLSGYDTSPEGELQHAAFQCGAQRDESLAPLYLGILQFQFLGRVSPGAEAHRDEPNLEKLTLALRRGEACRTELGGPGEFWPFVAQHLSDVRRSLGIPPICCSRVA
jgi:hypothetical protein